MMQLLCNGIRLDLYEGASLQFTQKNPLFAFDKLECERTTQFKLPRTPKNDQLLSLARIPAYDGMGMRRKFAAELQDGTIIKTGYLYVSGFDGTDYKAIFVTGEFVGLQAIKNLGKLADIISYNTVETFNTGGFQPSIVAGQIWRNAEYLREAGLPLNPSIKLSILYNDICTQYGITAQAIPSGADSVRIVPAELSGLKEQVVDIERHVLTRPAIGSYPTLTNIAIGVPEIFVQQTAKVSYREEIGGGTIDVYHGVVAQLKCMQDITIQFPDDWDDNLYVGQFLDGDSYIIGEFQFYGDRSFDEDGNVTGDSLAGRSVEIPQGQCLCIIHKNDYYKGATSGGTIVQGWYYTSEPGIEVTVNMSGNVTTMGAYVRLQDNLPDITFTELLKVIAALSGRVLNYSEANGLTFEDLDMTSYPVKDDVVLTKRGEVERTFADYQQHNRVQFDDERATKIITDYTIDNDNLKEDNDLQTVPFSEGQSSAGMLYVYADAEVDFLGGDNTGSSPRLTRVALPKNAGLQALCNASTQFKIECRMTLMEYNAITEKTLLLIDGTKYIWTDRSWQKNAAKFTLAKI